LSSTKNCGIEYKAYLNHANSLIAKAYMTIETLRLKKVPDAQLTCIVDYIDHAVRQVDHTRRRVLEGQVIPAEEKVYSIFQPHTEWVSKGKAGVPVELGLKVCVVECQHGFILHVRWAKLHTILQVKVLPWKAKLAPPSSESCAPSGNLRGEA
jgi:IS5 family transposase